MKTLKWVLIGIISMVAIFLLIGVFSPEHTAVSTVKVSASAQKCWSVFEDSSRMEEWMTGFKSIELQSGEVGVPGSISLVTLADPAGDDAQLYETLIAFNPPRNYQFDYYNDYVKGNVNIDFVESNGETTITSTNTYSGTSAFLKSMFYFMTENIQKTSDSQYQALKKSIEETPDSLVPAVEPAIQ